MVSKNQTLYAYEIHNSAGMPIVSAPTDREWMDATTQRFAYRCLPLVLANQAGWLIPCPASLTVRWNGGRRLRDTKIRFTRRPNDERVLSHFGHGILTFSIPYLFRTPRGINLWVKGPSNSIKDGIQPLEGIVETDWSPATFTMNWKLTRPNNPVRFKQGEPICMIVPVPRGLTESLAPRIVPPQKNRRLLAQHLKWQREREHFIQALFKGEPEAMKIKIAYNMETPLPCHDRRYAD